MTLGVSTLIKCTCIFAYIMLIQSKINIFSASKLKVAYKYELEKHVVIIILTVKIKLQCTINNIKPNTTKIYL